MPESLGARLRQQRERRHIGLATITEQTKIKQSLLEALERDDVSHWPDGIFRRAYIRAYAHAIGLDPDIIVREFLQRYPDPAEAVAIGSEDAPAVGRDQASRPPMRLRYLVASAVRPLSRRWHRAARMPGPAVEAPAESRDAPAAGRTPVEPDLAEVADVCTAFSRAATADAVAPLLRDAARILGATGIIVWVWDQQASRLRPALAHGYSERVLAQIPDLERDAPNATAAAFRFAQPRAVAGRDQASGALVVPLMTAAGCAGVLAIELEHDSAEAGSVRAVATIFAAQLARLIGLESQGDAADRRLA